MPHWKSWRICLIAPIKRLITGAESWGSRVKKTTLYEERDTQKRQEYLAEIKDIDSTKIVYVDESGIEDTLRRHYARATRGTPVITDIKGKKSQRISIIAGLLGKKLIAPLVFEGYTNTSVFAQWVQSCLLPELPPGHTMVIDNASFHRAPLIRTLIESAGCTLIYLPAYSPDFNDIEPWWAVLKTKVTEAIPKTDTLMQAIQNAFQSMNYHKKIHQ